MGIEEPEHDAEDVGGPGRRQLIQRFIAVVPAVLLVLVVGRVWLSDDNPVHADGEGILSVHAGPGAVAFDRKHPEREFWGTFGTYLLCLDEDAGDVEDVELTGYRYDSTIRPRKTYLGVRTITPRQVAAAGAGKRTEPIRSERGQPLEFRNEGRSAPATGSFHRGLQGVRVGTDCDDIGDFGSPQMSEPMRELLVVANAGPKGAYITSLEIDYEADGRTYTLRVDADLAICGSRITVCKVSGS